METIDIFPLTEQALVELLSDRADEHIKCSGNAKRKHPRWPFPGTVELWIPGDSGMERHLLATSVNLSLHGMGIRSDEKLDPDMELDIAIHEPEASFHGRGVIRHCTPLRSGQYIIGVQFLFPESS